VLRILEPAGAGAVAARAVPQDEDLAAESAMNPALKGFLWGAGSFAILAALGFFVWQSANPREEGGSPTGGLPTASQQQPQMPKDPIVAQLEAAVQREPDNLDLRNNLAQAYLENDNMMGVFEQTKYVLERKPNDSRALTFQGLVRMAMGELPAATTMIENATKSDPKNIDAWVALSWIYLQQDRVKDAEAMIAEAAKQSPNDKARLEQVFAQMKQHAEESKNPPSQSGAASELPPGHPPVDGAPAASAAPSAPPPSPSPAAGGERSVRVTLELDPAARGKQGVLYVMARNPQGGPPVAVKRMMVTQFPVTFDFGSADSMMGQPLPDTFRLEARLDSDGDAATKPPTDPSAMQNDVSPGTAVKLALK
jgi:tetratricopeptide (TPR) repeat protein